MAYYILQVKKKEHDNYQGFTLAPIIADTAERKVLTLYTPFAMPFIRYTHCLPSLWCNFMPFLRYTHCTCPACGANVCLF
jgi:hypothetical protein